MVKRKFSSGRRSVGFRVAKITSKIRDGVRKYFNEERNQAFTTTQNMVLWQTLADMGTTSEVESIIQAVDTGSVHTGIGENSLGAYSTTSIRRYYKADIYKYKKIVHLRNIDEHANFVTIYEVVAKKNCATQAATNACQHIIDCLYNGWLEFLPSGATSATSKSGDYVVYNTGSTYINTYTKYINPKQSKLFNEYYSIVKVKQLKLEPGDDVYYKMYTRNRVWNPTNIYPDGGEAETSTERTEIIKNYSKCLLLKIHGAIGRSSTASGQDTIGLMQTELAVDQITCCRVAPLQVGKHEVYHSLAHDDLTAITLQGPTDYEHKDDVN